MNPLTIQSVFIILFLYASSAGVTQTQAAKAKVDRVTCNNRGSKCFLKRITCPSECPKVQPANSAAQGCFVDCLSPKCEAVCRNRKPNCNGPGAACFDPRFVGGDGSVFYFHGRSNEHFSLVSDPNLQINAHFIGLRPVGRTQDFTWIQALGVMFGPKNFTLEATRAEKWNDDINHLKFSYNGKTILVPQGHSTEWNSPDNDLKVERTSSKNSVIVTIPEVVEIFVNVVPVSEQDNKIHNYQIPSNDSFAHLDVQFRFLGLSSKVDGVLGRTYRPDFEKPAKGGGDKEVVVGENKYRTSSLLSADCDSCVFSPSGVQAGDGMPMMEYGELNHAGGNGELCRK